MLSHALNELRRSMLNDAHGGRYIGSDDMIALAAKLSAFEAEAANLEATVRDARIINRLVPSLPLPPRRPFGRREGRRPL